MWFHVFVHGKVLLDKFIASVVGCIGFLRGAASFGYQELAWVYVRNLFPTHIIVIGKKDLHYEFPGGDLKKPTCAPLASDLN